LLYGDGTFVAVGDAWSYTHEPTSAILTSTDAFDWEPQYYAGASESLLGVAYGNGTFVAVGYNGTVLSSTDTIVWNKGDSGTNAAVTLEGVAYGGGVFVAVGYGFDVTGGVVPVVLTSSDGLTWTNAPVKEKGQLYGVSYGGGTWLAVGGRHGVSFWFTSQDGLRWEENSYRDQMLFSAAWGNGYFVAVGGEYVDSALRVVFQRIEVTSTGVEVRSTHQTAYEPLKSVAFGRGHFVAVGGGVYTSSDGEAWATIDSVPSFKGNGVAFGAETFVTVGNWGGILQSDPLVNAAPAIAQEPIDCHVVSGATASFAVAASGSSPIRYQWRGPSGAIDGATNAVLVLRNVRDIDVGEYRVTASNAYGSAISLPALLNLGPAPGEIVRLSVGVNFYPELILSGSVGRYRIDLAESLAFGSEWRPLTTISVSDIPYLWTDVEGHGSASRFYRAILQP